MPPQITIVMPVLNRAGMIGRALDSIAGQTGGMGVRCLVMDGGSSDGTQTVAARYPFVTVRSGPDRGLYDALNTGIDLADGDVVGFLNSDDRYAPGAFAAALDGFAADPAAQSVCGGAIEELLQPDGGRTELRRWQDVETKALSWEVACSGAPIINARFFRRDWLAQGPRFPLRWRIAADRAFLIAAMRTGLRTAVLPSVTYCYGIHAGSLTFRPEGRVGLDCLAEYRDIAAGLLGEADTPALLRTAAARWFARDTALATQALLRTGRPGTAIGLAVGGLRVYPAWPVRALVHAGAKAVEGIRRARGHLQTGTVP